jgi:two-component system, sensor histidine kinase
VVEDNPTNRLVASRILRQLGAEVATAENGAEGVVAVEREDFDLVFMDIQMPVMDGVEATRRIRALPAPKRHVPILATTANVMPAQLAAYRACGVSGVVAKPISPAALLSEVARIAGQAA